MLRAEAALLTALATTGVAPSAAGEAASTVTALEVDVRALRRRRRPGWQPGHPAGAAGPGGRRPEVAPWVHFGATSQDVVDTALMLVASDVLRRVEADLTSLAGFLASLCDADRSVPMVARTLTQQALPDHARHAGGRLAGRGARRRTGGADVHDLPVSLGGPVGHASAYGGRGPAVLEAFAAALGRRAPVVLVAHPAHPGGRAGHRADRDRRGAAARSPRTCW